MAQNWDYALMSKAAKVAGDPEKKLKCLCRTVEILEERREQNERKAK